MAKVFKAIRYIIHYCMTTPTWELGPDSVVLGAMSTALLVVLTFKVSQ